MAYKDSDELKTDERYSLGDYSFRIERSSVPGSTNDKIEAICTDKSGKNARKSIQIPSSTQMSGWYVEANSDTASVYAVVDIPEGMPGKQSSLDTSPVPNPVPIVTSFETGFSNPDFDYKYIGQISGIGGFFSSEIHDSKYIVASATSGASFIYFHHGFGPNYDSFKYRWYSNESSYTYNGKTVYYRYGGTNASGDTGWPVGVAISGAITKPEAVAWTMVYGTDVYPEYGKQEKLVARFAIELEDADGTGPDSDWDDPGDYDPDWEEGDPTHTLYVEVTGALSGRHNDPIEDPSYSYIPADKDTVKNYGCGGDGGHGGGGGAGASTVVVHKFATNQANSKEVTALARRHGYGSGGGKGGKGGDGCILVYY